VLGVNVPNFKPPSPSVLVGVVGVLGVVDGVGFSVLVDISLLVPNIPQAEVSKLRLISVKARVNLVLRFLIFDFYSQLFNDIKF
jgi:hypothetical protein